MEAGELDGAETDKKDVTAFAEKVAYPRRRYGFVPSLGRLNVFVALEYQQRLTPRS